MNFLISKDHLHECSLAHACDDRASVKLHLSITVYKERLQKFNHHENFIVCVCIQKTPDNDFIIDKHPEHSNIIIGIGFTGMCE